MEVIQLYGWALLRGLLSFFINPFVYVFSVLVWMHYRRQTLFERKLFSVRINNYWEIWFDTVLKGFLPGLILSIVAIASGIVIDPITMIIVGSVALLLSCFHIQYLCTAYAGGIVVLLSLGAKHISGLVSLPVLGWIVSKLQAVNIPSLLILIALLHVIEAILTKKNAGKGSSPLLLSGKRGLLVGAYFLQKFWFIPFIAVHASTSGMGLPHVPSWWSFISGSPVTGATFSLLPAVIGNSTFTMASLPEHRAQQTAKRFMIYSILLLVFAIGSIFWSPLAIGAAAFALLGHEFLNRFMNWRERVKGSIFVQLKKGVRVLAVIPKTPADRLGIRAGEIVVKINGMDVNHPKHIYPALQVNTAFCKIEVLNEEGHTKYLQCSVYQGDHHQLGLILAPDEEAEIYVDLKAVNIVRLIRQQIDRGA